jgi:hypothetical protein
MKLWKQCINEKVNTFSLADTYFFPADEVSIVTSISRQNRKRILHYGILVSVAHIAVPPNMILAIFELHILFCSKHIETYSNDTTWLFQKDAAFHLLYVLLLLG